MVRWIFELVGFCDGLVYGLGYWLVEVVFVVVL